MSKSKLIELPLIALDFYPPMKGLDGRFNTFRLGLAWSRRVKKGDTVLLIDKRKNIAFDTARVTGVHTGTLPEMASLHAAKNHNQRDDPINAPDNIITALLKRYGPHKVTPLRMFTVIDLWRLKR